MLAIAVPLVRELALDRLDASGTLTAVKVRDAARDVYDAYLSDLLVWALVLALAGLLLSAAAVATSRLRRPPTGPPERALHWPGRRP